MCYIRVRLVHHARRYRSCAYKGRPAKSIEIQRNGQHELEYTACCNAILRKKPNKSIEECRDSFHAKDRTAYDWDKRARWTLFRWRR